MRCYADVRGRVLTRNLSGTWSASHGHGHDSLKVPLLVEGEALLTVIDTGELWVSINASLSVSDV